MVELVVITETRDGGDSGYHRDMRWWRQWLLLKHKMLETVVIAET